MISTKSAMSCFHWGTFIYIEVMEGSLFEWEWLRVLEGYGVDDKVGVDRSDKGSLRSARVSDVL